MDFALYAFAFVGVCVAAVAALVVAIAVLMLLPERLSTEEKLREKDRELIRLRHRIKHGDWPPAGAKP